MTNPTEAFDGEWRAVRPERAPHLTDARLQLHHAAQLPVAFAISYLVPKPDDSHTNLEWRPDLAALVSNPVTAGASRLRVAIRIEDLALLFLRDTSAVAEMALTGSTVAAGAQWMLSELRGTGLATDRFTLTKHYEIPPHPVGTGAAFNPARDDLRELATWYSNAAALLETVRAGTTGASAVRCWPHHFDIASLITPSAGTSVGVGLEPGDGYYDEPYFYVNAYPAPAPSALPQTLAGGGSWHTREWIGAVLRGSRIAGDAPAQQRQAAAFVRSAVSACRSLVSA